VALASAGFAIGSQQDDGSAGAAGSEGPGAGERVIHFRGGPGGPGGPGARFGDLAERLGVSEADLRKALEELRPAGDPKDELAAALAQSLNLDQAKVEEALAGLHGSHERRHEEARGEFAAALAEELGLEAGAVEAALDKVKPGPPRRPRPGRRLPRPPRPDALIGDLAAELGVSRVKLRAALRAVRPDIGPGRGHGGPGPGHRGPGGPGGPRGMLADELADALGVEADAVEQALEDFHDAKRADFVKKLAEKLGIEEDKVEEALPPRP
jgi:biotin operon repressor